MEINSLKHLTKSQQKKAEKITELLLELKKSGVHPIVIDGGGGNGLQFVRCSTKDLFEVGDLILNNDCLDGEIELDDYIYSPNGYYKYNIDYLAP